MEISTATASSLGNKLAGLDLSDQEGVLLAALLGAGDHESDDVQGFGKGAPEPQANGLVFENVTIKMRPNVLGPLPGAWKKPEGDGYLIITMTN